MTNPKVVVVHQGSQPYLMDCLNSSMRMNHDTFLIGNDSTMAAHCTEFFDDQIFIEKYEYFLRLYKHYSTNSLEFELHCFKRFFLLSSIAEKLNLENFWLIDSDVLLLKNLNEISNYILSSGYVASLSWQNQSFSSMKWSASPHVSFWTLDGLRDFLDFLVDLYLPKNIKILEGKHAHHQKNNILGGICDMTALYLWAHSGVSVHNSAIASDSLNYFFDHNVNDGSNYKDSEYRVVPILGVKKVNMDSKLKKYYVFASNGSKREVVNLHFQGGSKVLMSRFLFVNKLSLLSHIRFFPRAIYRKCRNVFGSFF
jgi:hypothetical protein